MANIVLIVIRESWPVVREGRLLKKFIMKMMMASKGIIYSFYTV